MFVQMYKNKPIFGLQIAINLIFILFSNMPVYGNNIPSINFSLAPIYETSAQVLGKNMLALDARQRIYNDISKVDGKDTPFFLGASIIYGLGHKTDLQLGAQVFDSSYLTDLNGRINNGNYEFTLGLKHNFFTDQSQRHMISAGFWLSGYQRGATFFSPPQPEIDGSGIIPKISAQYSWVKKKLSFSIAPTAVLYKKNSASFLPSNPYDFEAFGPLLGFGSAVSYNFHKKLGLWSSVFQAVYGSNSLNFSPHEPKKTLRYDIGLQYRVNPYISTDLFLSNGLGNIGALSPLAESRVNGLGLAMTVYPNFKKADSSQSRYSSSIHHPFTVSSSIASNSQHLSFEYEFVPDLTAFIYINYVFGQTDESEQGIGGKLTLLEVVNAQQKAFRISLMPTMARGNNLLENFRQENRDLFIQSPVKKRIPFILSGDHEGPGDLKTLWIISSALPIDISLLNRTHVQIAPAVGYVQRRGLVFYGLQNALDYFFIKNTAIYLQNTINFSNNENTFVGSSLKKKLPMEFGVKRNFVLSNNAILQKLNASVFIGNTLGPTTWNRFRVNADNKFSFGLRLKANF
ncbi:MAG TPA: hypothetical protein PKC21_03735 [Oligoflexia bacterium]|nr:hypothetical protein [Oligoflexia bacterium]HMR24448.1 hypothetical protein [Oligoflexia bacterium]